jgi:site-specific recombinase XerC
MLNGGADLRSFQELLGLPHLYHQIYTHLTSDIPQAYVKAHPRAKTKEN